MSAPPLRKRQLTRTFTLCCAAAIGILFSGCEVTEEVALIEGVVTMGGEPLADVEVVFLPDRELGTTGPRSSALTDAQGYYAMTYNRAGQLGTVPGFHRVCVKDFTVMPIIRLRAEPEDGPVCSCNGARIPREYASAARTPLRVEVSPGRQVCDLDLQPE